MRARDVAHRSTEPQRLVRRSARRARSASRPTRCRSGQMRRENLRRPDLAYPETSSSVSRECRLSSVVACRTSRMSAKSLNASRRRSATGADTSFVNRCDMTKAQRLEHVAMRSGARPRHLDRAHERVRHARHRRHDHRAPRLAAVGDNVRDAPKAAGVRQAAAAKLVHDAPRRHRDPTRRSDE
jgi:hypothetical protein